MARKFVYKDSLIKTVKIDISQEMEADEDQEVYIVLRELPTGNMIDLSQIQEAGGVQEMVKYFLDVFPEILVEHNIYVDEDTLMSAEQLNKLLKNKSDLAVKVVDAYSKAAFFTQAGKTLEK